MGAIKMYNLTNLTQSATIGEQIQHLNSLSDGFLGVAILLSFWFIILMATKRYDKDFKEGMIVSSALTVFLSIPLFAFQITTWKPMAFCIVILLASILVYKFTD
jgi:hypothetical protein